MQKLLPTFPFKAKMINSDVSVLCEEDTVYYFHYDVPIFSHNNKDLECFHCITSKFIILGLCNKKEIQNCFGVSNPSINRNVKRLRKNGDRNFFNFTENRRGKCYKLVPEVVSQIQYYLDKGKNNSEIARLEGITEGDIRYDFKKGRLKKTFMLTEHKHANIKRVKNKK